MAKPDLDPAARERMTASKAESRGACWTCGLARGAACHVGSVPDEVWWWQHEYEPAILTRVRKP